MGEAGVDAWRVQKLKASFRGRLVVRGGFEFFVIGEDSEWIRGRVVNAEVASDQVWKITLLEGYFWGDGAVVPAFLPGVYIVESKFTG